MAILKKLLGASLITLGFFSLGYWLWPSGIFQTPLGELTIGNLTWGALSICVWVGGCRYLGSEVTALNKRLSDIDEGEKIVIDCPYCDRKMRIPVGKRLQVKCPNTACEGEFRYGDAKSIFSGNYVRLSSGLALFILIAVFVLYPALQRSQMPAESRYAAICDAPDPSTGVRRIENYRVSPSQCRDWEQFWCVVYRDALDAVPKVVDESLTCKVTLYLMSEKEKDSIRSSEHFGVQFFSTAFRKLGQ